MNSTKKFHILDFPNETYVKIEDNFRKKLFSKLYKKYAKKKSAKVFGISPKTMTQYEKAFSIKYGMKHSQAIPVSFLKKIVKLEDQEELEKNIISISVRRGLKVKNPKLPIKESSELYSFIGHMIADGSQSKHHTPYYVNSDETLRKRFKEKVALFGSFDIKESKTITSTIIEFPKVITDIVQHLFDFQITHPNRIPKRLFSTTEECKSVFIGALFDDDGTVSGSIVLTIHNLNLIKQVKELLKSLDIKTNKISIFKYKNKKDKIALQVSSKSIKRFHDLILLEHPQKKLNLKYKIKTIKRNKEVRTRNPKLIQEEILEMLEKKPSRTMKIANHLFLTINGVTPHLNILEKEGLIIKKGQRNKVIWDLV